MNNKIYFGLIILVFCIFNRCQKAETAIYKYSIDVPLIPLKISIDSTKIVGSYFPITNSKSLNNFIYLKITLNNKYSLNDYQVDSIIIDSSFVYLDQADTLTFRNIDSLKIYLTDPSNGNLLIPVSQKLGIVSNNTKILKLDPLNDVKYQSGRNDKTPLLLTDVCDFSISGNANGKFNNIHNANLLIKISIYVHPFKKSS